MGRPPLRAAIREQSGQATLEAALLLPCLMVCLALLVQPACLLYTRSVMQAAAAEGCRLLLTIPSVGGITDGTYRIYIERRLAAVPAIDIFHKGGARGWTIELARPSARGEVGVRITTSVRPLPLFGVAAFLLGESDGDGGVVIRAEATATLRPSWLEGGYAGWSSMWG